MEGFADGREGGSMQDGAQGGPWRSLRTALVGLGQGSRKGL